MDYDKGRRVGFVPTPSGNETVILSQYQAHTIPHVGTAGTVQPHPCDYYRAASNGEGHSHAQTGVNFLPDGAMLSGVM